MKTLKDILNNKEIMYKLVEVFGFTKPKIYCDLEDDELQLVVEEDPNADEQYDTALSASLIEKLDCQSSVLISSNIKGLYKDSILERSTSLEDISKIESLYGKPLQEIEFREPDNDEESEYFFNQGKYLADKILKEISLTTDISNKTHNSINKRKSDTEISSNREKLIKIILDPSNKYLIEEKLSNLSSDAFSILENIFIDLIKPDQQVNAKR